MGDTENKPTLEEVTIDSSITNSSQVNHALSVHDQEAKTVQSREYSSILTTIHAGYFRITMSLGAQALLWKVLRLSTDDPHQAIHHMFQTLPSITCLLLWFLALFAIVSLSFLYFLRCFFHFNMVRAEFLHHIGANYLYAPWISWLLLLQSAPVVVPRTVFYQVLWWVFTVPILVLDLKIYGQWFTTEKRFLSMVANPTSQISVIGNLMGALAAALMGWKESAVFMFSLGMAHYFVLFVTLYQRLAGGSRFPAMMRPSFFLFSAAPSLASLAWTSISGAFDTVSKMFFFLSLFLFMSLVKLHSNSRPYLYRL